MAYLKFALKNKNNVLGKVMLCLRERVWMKWIKFLDWLYREEWEL